MVLFMANMYTERVKNHFFHPRNVGEIKNADGVGTVGNPICGDVMTIYIKVKNNKIEDIKFKTYGCAAAVASSSIATEMVKGKTLDEAYRLTRDDVSNELGGLPAVKLHCSNLAADGLHNAIEDYLKKTGRTIEDL